jgi:hypothetical protein
LTIANDAVTNAKAANMVTGTIKGRIAGGTGDPEDLTAAQARTLLNVADGATQNSTNATLLARANHTGTQALSTIAGITATAAEINHTDGVTSSIQAQLNSKASLASPALTGAPTAPTAGAATNTTQLATTAFTRTAIPAVLNASGSAPIYACRAWVNFNGTGTVAIRASGNVSSITENGVGDYTVNFTTAMQDANYSVAASAMDTAAPSAARYFVTGRGTNNQLTTAFRFYTGSAAAEFDVASCQLAIFR